MFLGYRRIARLYDGDRVVVRHVVVEVNARCVASHILQHVVILWFVVKTDDAVVVHLVDFARLGDRR